MKTTLIIFCCLCLFSFAHAQEMNEEVPALARHSVFVELGGNGGIYSLNYDRLLHRGEWFRTSARAGVFCNWWQKGAFGIPLEFNGLIGKDKHFFEMGLGAMYSYGLAAVIWRESSRFGREGGRENFSGLRMSGRLGYRFQKPEGGFFLRVAYTPTTEITNNIPYYGDPDFPYYFKESEKGFQGLQSIWHWFGISVGKSF